jgi:DNA-binding IclR family transcriptional regulator
MTGAPAASAVLRILRLLGDQSVPLRASTMARELGLPRSTVYKLIRVLQDEGFVMHFPEERGYTLSLRAMTLVADDRNDNRLARVAVPLIRRMVRAFDVPVVAHLSVLTSTDVVYRAKVATPRAPTLTTEIGVHLPAHLTATGRSMLALLPREQVRALYPTDSSLVSRTGRGPASRRELRELLSAVRDRGYAAEHGDVASGLSAIAAPILDYNGHPVASVGVTFRAEALDRSEWSNVASRVMSTAAAIGMRVRGAI